ncbi:hypothetical protein E2C01_099275 [Portunus trituberculatus]|uniref:Uncharacterized protein n=1 Tax=Portunus trituberculatus TaxID=210409 RepID=A0A5B7K533_PORTR|nr:hypothetical protein [Portunus trituberculatus]
MLAEAAVVAVVVVVVVEVVHNNGRGQEGRPPRPPASPALASRGPEPSYHWTIFDLLTPPQFPRVLHPLYALPTLPLPPSISLVALPASPSLLVCSDEAAEEK